MGKTKRSPLKKIVLGTVIVFTLLFLIAAWLFFGSAVVCSQKDSFLKIRSTDRMDDVLNQLIKQDFLNDTKTFSFLASLYGYSDPIKPGKYALYDGMSLFSLVRTLKAGQQKEVRLVIGKSRLNEELAGKLGRHLEADSTDIIRFLQSPDSLKSYNLEPTTAFMAFIPNTYNVWWNGHFGRTFKRLYDQQQLFWKGERTDKAARAGLTKKEVYIIASLVEEETNRKTDKPIIASVYINRVRKGMRLESCPTIKYARKDFAMTRILNEHLQVVSPYNTYKNNGLPPGPICIPSIESIDAVLNAPPTEFLFFSANSAMNGDTDFSKTYEEHLRKAVIYQRRLDSLSAQKNKHP
ncbi:MAG: endolytic transglycosylase MltG [Ferruginibacter sp.]